VVAICAVCVVASFLHPGVVGRSTLLAVLASLFFAPFALAHTAFDVADKPTRLVPRDAAKFDEYNAQPEVHDGRGETAVGATVVEGDGGRGRRR
jgi:hypothetical protein